jgi:predicted metal-dependent peptidase
MGYNSEESVMDKYKILRQDIKDLVVSQPFFASIILRQKLEVTDQCDTAAVNGVTLRVNPEWYYKLDPYERMTVLAHEALHLTNKHNLRRNGRNFRLWNVACDMAINKHLARHPFKLPKEGTYDKDNKYGDGADAETIYSKLMDEVSKQQQEQQQDKSPDEDEQEESGSSDTSSPLEKAIDQVAQNHGGGGMGDVEDHPLAQECKDELENQQDVATNQAMQQAKKRGKMPSSVEEDITRNYDKKVSWQALLSRWIEGVTQADYNWLYPHDVHLQNDLIMPSMRSESYGEVCIAIDTSASMEEEDLRIAVSEVFNALEAYHVNEQSDAKVTILYFDCRVHKVDVITDPSQITKPVGRGGTDYCPVFDHIKEDNVFNPKALIFVTDGYCYVNANDKPEMDVIWMLTSDLTAKSFNPPFGDCIEVG